MHPGRDPASELIEGSARLGSSGVHCHPGPAHARDMIEDFKLFRSSQPGPRGWEEVQVATGGSQRTSPDGQAARTPSRMPRMSGVLREFSPAASDFTATSASTFASTRRDAVDEAEAARDYN